MNNRQVAEEYARAIQIGDFDNWESLLHPDVLVHYPQSGEVIRGRDNFVAMTRNYPGLPEGEAGRLSGGERTIHIAGSLPFQPPKVLTLGDGDTVFSEWTATYPDGSVYQVVSILKMANHQIIEETSYFAEPFDAPDWRAPFRESP